MGCLNTKNKIIPNVYIPPELDSSQKLKKEDMIGLNSNDIIDVYDIGKMLGVGGYGEVKHAIHRRNKFERAIKIVKTATFTIAEKNQALLEIDILRKLVFCLCYSESSKYFSYL